MALNMWRWQLKSVRKRYTLWAQLVIISGIAHVIMLFFLFFVYRDRADYAVTINHNLLNQDVSILIMRAQMAPRNRTGVRGIQSASQKKGVQPKVPVPAA
ncbi:MAG: hypothetical protein Q8Q25_00685, partial [bacterium]|nr:hypothetical protein [bacterium]